MFLDQKESSFETDFVRCQGTCEDAIVMKDGIRAVQESIYKFKFLELD